MTAETQNRSGTRWPTLSHFPLPAKVLATMVIVTLAVAMLGALAQVVVHDIIPTFSEMNADAGSGSEAGHPATDALSTDKPGAGRGDLFSEEITAAEKREHQPFYQSEQIIWTLKWTHIHLFGINMIFIFLGAITVFLNLSASARAWLVGLPFLGILLDIATMWLKAFVSPVFFWLHIPGGGLFGAVFVYVSFRALREMWWLSKDRII